MQYMKSGTKEPTGSEPENPQPQSDETTSSESRKPYQKLSLEERSRLLRMLGQEISSGRVKVGPFEDEQTVH